MNGQARRLAPGRPFQLLAQVTQPVTAPAPASLRVDSARLSVETTAQLQTLLTLCQRLVGASSGQISVQLDGGWMTLVQSNLPTSDVDRRVTVAPSTALTEEQGGAHYMVRLPTSPALALALTVERPIRAATARLLREALELALPVLQAGEGMLRAEETRLRVLNLQAELAHELRTPLTAISGFAQLLQRPGRLDEARRRSYAGIAVTESQQATAIIDHFVARLQAEAEALGSAGEPEAAAAPPSPPQRPPE